MAGEYPGIYKEKGKERYVVVVGYGVDTLTIRPCNREGRVRMSYVRITRVNRERFPKRFEKYDSSDVQNSSLTPQTSQD